ncbi:hypothetical protein C8J57DRAFT_1369235, partial [Mycena rebaudengoi]
MAPHPHPHSKSPNGRRITAPSRRRGVPTPTLNRRRLHPRHGRHRAPGAAVPAPAEPRNGDRDRHAVGGRRVVVVVARRGPGRRPQNTPHPDARRGLVLALRCAVHVRRDQVRVLLVLAPHAAQVVVDVCGRVPRRDHGQVLLMLAPVAQVTRGSEVVLRTPQREARAGVLG